MTVTSGLRCFALSAKSARCGCLAKMCLESSIWHSTRCYLTWKMQDTKGKRLLYRLAASTPRTSESACALWPTPSTGAALCGGTGNFKTLKAMKSAGLITEEERRQLSAGNGGNTNPGLLEWLMGYEQAFTQLIPTPIQTDYKGGKASRFFLGGLQTRSERISGMHPAWENWPDEPNVDRVAHGIPDRVDRIKALGNAVVPQQFYLFFKLIADIITGGSET